MTTSEIMPMVQSPLQAPWPEPSRDHGYLCVCVCVCVVRACVRACVFNHWGITSEANTKLSTRERQEEYRQRHDARPSVLRARCWELLARGPEATARGPCLVAPSDVRVRTWPVGKPAVVRVDARNWVASPR
jgi:hypothetical protein